MFVKKKGIDIVQEIGGIKSFEGARSLFEKILDQPKSFKNS